MSTPQTLSILITGASGFIGSFMVEEALKKGYETWAGIRKNSSKKYLTNKGIHFIELDFDNPEKLQKQLHGHSFDYVIHAAGVTKTQNTNDFFRVNTQGTINLVNALKRVNTSLKKFVFISSLSVCGPIKEDYPYKDILIEDKPQPNTQYGQSKLMAEKFLDSLKDFPAVTLRLTGVYGPREKDYFLMAKSIKNHVDFALGFKPQDLTFVYVMDAVEASFLALNKGTNGSKYFISDGEIYSSRSFSDLISHQLGNKWMIRIKSPLWAFRCITFFSDIFGRITKSISTLNKDKYNILKQRNWRCDISSAVNELGYTPQYNLSLGVKLTIEWYLKNHWL